MHPFPHHYAVTGSAQPSGEVVLSSPGLPDLPSAPPTEFDGPGDRWSPETLLSAAVADCFILTFRSVARLSKLEWTSLTCDVSGTVDRLDRVTQFTALQIRARLAVPPGTDEAKALNAMAKAKQGCLITASLKAEAHLDAQVVPG